MAITKEKKQEIGAKLNDIFTTSKSVAFVNFHGMSVADVTKARSTLREQSVGYFVAKKTLVRRAIQEAGISGDIPELAGELAVAYSEDELASPREIHKLTKEYKDSMVLLGGIFEGALQNKEAITEIATIPPIEVLRGMFVNVINSPIQRLAIVTSEIAKIKEA